MLCSHGLQSALTPSMDFYWPVLSLWPEVNPLVYQEHLLHTNLQELSSSLELMDQLQHNVLEETEPFQSIVAVQPASRQLDTEGGERFAVTLDTQGFSPEEPSVRQVGRKLRVSGKTEKKQEDGNGWMFLKGWTLKPSAAACLQTGSSTSRQPELHVQRRLRGSWLSGGAGRRKHSRVCVHRHKTAAHRTHLETWTGPDWMLWCH
uniref:SHSP domain-containing protein n=1 Tax=Stegastes partitus TaxID=144197 RepID=A0A3B5BBI1_9TELE